MEWKGGRVRGKVLFNKSFTASSNESGDQRLQSRGKPGNLFWGGSMKNHGIKKSKLDSVVKNSQG